MYIFFFLEAVFVVASFLKHELNHTAESINFTSSFWCSPPLLRLKLPNREAKFLLTEVVDPFKFRVMLVIK